MRKDLFPGFCIFLGLLSSHPATSQEVPAPYSEYYGKVERVIDGDTMEVRIDLWPGFEAIYAVRARGIDAPELRGAKCPEEKQWAEEARDRVTKLYGPGTTVRIENVEIDSFGRAVADIRRWRSDRWLYFADEMVDAGMADAWQENWPDIEWCALASQR